MKHGFFSLGLKSCHPNATISIRVARVIEWNDRSMIVAALIGGMTAP